MNEHLGEDAELYALGLLGPADAERIESHVAACAECARRLGEAEHVVAELAVVPVAARAQAPARRRTVPVWYALAAAFVLMLGVTVASLFQAQTLALRSAADDAILATIATSHFNHTDFTPLVAGAPVAKVLNARTGEWLYIIVDGAVPGCTAYATRGDSRVELGDIALHGKTSTLFVRNPGVLTRLELVRNGAVMESASPQYGEQ